MQRQSYRPDIDGLRALAIVPVLLFHAGVAGVPGGFVGVDVFFVISGYLISKHIFEALGAGQFSFVAFFERRARRIAPAFFAVSLATFIACLVLLFPTRFVEFSESLLWSSLALGNVYFWQQSGYFGQEPAMQPLLHFWSLGVEEQFYFLFPGLAFLGWRLGRRTLAWLLAAAFLASIIAAELFVRAAPEAVFFLLPFRAWELLLGSLLALPGVKAPHTRAVGAAATALGVAMILTSVALYSENTTFPGVAALLPVAGSGLVIWGGRVANAASSGLGISPLTYLGRISYSLYLVHWPVLFFSRMLLADMAQPLRTAVVILVSVALADLSYRFVETPPRRQLAFWSRARIFGITFGASAIGVAISLAMIVSDGMSWRLPSDAQAILAYSYDRQGEYREGTCFLRRDQDFDAIDAATCLPTADNVALVWGDSHAAHFVPGLQPVLVDRGYKLAQLTASGCPPILAQNPPRRPNCQAFNDLAFDWIIKNRPALVIFSAIWRLDPASVGQLNRQITELNRLGIEMVILGPSPVFPEKIPVLLAERRTRGDTGATSTGDISASVFDYDNRLRKTFAAGPARYISVLDAACPGRICALIVGDEPIYWDTEHLTTAGATVLAKALADQLPRERPSN